MELYVGLDVSLKETSICVVDGKGNIVAEAECDVSATRNVACGSWLCKNGCRAL